MRKRDNTGTHNPRARQTEDEVRAVYADAARGLPDTVIARERGLPSESVRKIRLRISPGGWTHLDLGPPIETVVLTKLSIDEHLARMLGPITADGHQEWRGPLDNNNLPTIFADGREGLGRIMQVARLRYTRLVGPLPSSQVVERTCDIQRCVAIAHLRVRARQAVAVEAKRSRRIMLFCERCGDGFTINPARAEARRFCTDACRRAGPLSDTMERLMSRVTDGPNGCWDRAGAHHAEGYPVIWDGEAKRQVKCATYMWEKTNGRKVPEGQQVRHTCDRPICVQPKHLLIGTAWDNARDRIDRGRARPTGAVGSRNSHAKLNETDIPRVRELIASGLSDVAVGALVGVTSGRILRIRRGLSWTNVLDADGQPPAVIGGRKRGQISPEAEQRVLELYATGKYTQKQLAAECGVHQTAISKLLARARRQASDSNGEG